VTGPLNTDPRYNGTHICPGCGMYSRWICVHERPVVVRVLCDNGCGAFESTFSELQTFPHFDKPRINSPSSTLRTSLSPC
jgi:hypothetical protein